MHGRAGYCEELKTTRIQTDRGAALSRSAPQSQCGLIASQLLNFSTSQVRFNLRRWSEAFCKKQDHFTFPHFQLETPEKVAAVLDDAHVWSRVGDKHPETVGTIRAPPRSSSQGSSSTSPVAPSDMKGASSPASSACNHLAAASSSQRQELDRRLARSLTRLAYRPAAETSALREDPYRNLARFPNPSRPSTRCRDFGVVRRPRSKPLPLSKTTYRTSQASGKPATESPSSRGTLSPLLTRPAIQIVRHDLPILRKFN
ncbi:hypothetical protein BDK51DRAFT_41789 [Blyttiomyces helicus]|uniref:Uncharacterized protein n=1 Tax=Blyttiomyces helicus TaxID=388810 RepID=A0A4P9W9E7_9FUNG|nr:hypothetical protein BDK51DRAFT_41789 [Blyttiomyces helicus]|eukprot:RKO87738.1 hypothetical protein BDK51DRAFT_41789 [Blyttiomyces helicus]